MTIPAGGVNARVASGCAVRMAKELKNCPVTDATNPQVTIQLKPASATGQSYLSHCSPPPANPQLTFVEHILHCPAFTKLSPACHGAVFDEFLI
jgi:hypothetical protein